ncbi:3-keto sterol reductase [Mycena pura]|uniref:3-keto sterol reductase n=1 Tax=Mycena pura TaxID=153505 RepID=A0AAD6YU85_9AGAR|nr:3-keto sterol reductase [Mycena pura]
MSASPVVIVTGANAGIGYGICRRLLFQLCVSNPPDSWPQPWATRAKELSLEPPTGNGLTLIMACRSIQRATAARDELYHELDGHIKQLRAHPEYDGYADEFRHNLTIQVEYVDLAVLSTVFDFSSRVSKQYSHISHIICNAGVADFSHIDWLLCIKQLAMGFLSAITRPQFYVQNVGQVSVDGLGYVWQTNLFGHYVLVRSLEPLLQNSVYPADSRIIWTSSIETSKFYDDDDWQLTKTAHSYQSVKYQIELIATVLNHRALQISSAKRIRHFVSNPGSCSTKISDKLVEQGSFLKNLAVIMFYIGRLFARHLTITPAKAAISAVHLSLVAISFITFSTSDPVRFDSETDRWGNAEVGTTPVPKWKENEAHGELLVKKCDKLYQESLEDRKTA